MEVSFKKDNRKVLLILPQFQLKFLRFLLLMVVLVCLLFTASMFGFVEYWKHVGVNAGLPENSVFFDFLEQMRMSLGYILGGTLLLTAVVILAIGVYVSHRIAGPIYNILKYFKDMKTNGWVRPLSFRTDDYFPELTESLNSFMDDHKISKQGKNETK